MTSTSKTQTPSTAAPSTPSQSTIVSPDGPALQSEAATSATASNLSRKPRTSNITAGLPCRTVNCSFYEQGYNQRQDWPDKQEVAFFGQPTDASLTIARYANNDIIPNMTFATIAGKGGESRLFSMSDIRNVQFIARPGVVSGGCVLGDVPFGTGWDKGVQPIALVWPPDAGVKEGKETTCTYWAVDH